ncbi:MAG: hypothetical protein WCK05_13060 [Planctomycetota bacterium]
MTVVYRATPGMVDEARTVRFAVSDLGINRSARNEKGQHIAGIQQTNPGEVIALAMGQRVLVVGMIATPLSPVMLGGGPIDFVGCAPDRNGLADRMIQAGYPMSGGKGVEIIRLRRGAISPIRLPNPRYLNGRDYVLRGTYGGNNAIFGMDVLDQQGLYEVITAVSNDEFVG